MQITRRNARTYLRALFAVVVFVFGWYFAMSLRTMQFGESTQSLKIYILVSVPVFLAAILIFADRITSPATFKRALIFTTSVIITTAAFTGVEEKAVVRVFSQTCKVSQMVECDALGSEGTYVYSRWLFPGHTIVFSSEEGWRGTD